MKKLLMFITVMFVASSGWAGTQSISCVGERFTPEAKWPKTTITFDQANSILRVESTSNEVAFSDSNGSKIEKLEITNVDCDLPSIDQGIFWCRFRGYNRNGLPLSKVEASFFNGNTIKGTVGGSIQGTKITIDSTGLDGTVKNRSFKMTTITLRVKQSNYYSELPLLDNLSGRKPSCNRIL